MKSENVDGYVWRVSVDYFCHVIPPPAVPAVSTLPNLLLRDLSHMLAFLRYLFVCVLEQLLYFSNCLTEFESSGTHTTSKLPGTDAPSEILTSQVAEEEKVVFTYPLA